MRRLVAAGLCATDGVARRQCMLQTALLKSKTLEWLLERKAAVQEVGGRLEDVQAACCQDGSLRQSLPCALLWQRSGCAALLLFLRCRTLLM